MQKLDLNRGDLATIHPPLNGAAYELDGTYYDVQGRPMAKDANGEPIPMDTADEPAQSPSKPAGKAKAAGKGKPKADDVNPPKDAAELAEWIDAGAVNYLIALKFARQFLGAKAPRPKDELIKALRQHGKAPAPVQQQPEVERKADKVDAVVGNIDLAAWGRGQANYLAGDIYKAIGERFGRRVMETRDAVDVLIKEGVITEDQARPVRRRQV